MAQAAHFPFPHHADPHLPHEEAEVRLARAAWRWMRKQWRQGEVRLKEPGSPAWRAGLPSAYQPLRLPQLGGHGEMVSGEGVVEMAFEHPEQGGIDSGMGKLPLELGLPA